MARKPKHAGEARPRATENRASQVAYWALVAAVFAVPVATSNFTWLGFPSAFTADLFETVKLFVMRACVLTSGAAWAWGILRRGGHVRWSRHDWLVVALLVWSALSTILSPQPLVAFLGTYGRYDGFSTLLLCALAYFLVVQLVDRASRIRTLASALFFSACIVSAYGVAQSLGLDPNRWGPSSFEPLRAFSTFGNPDLLGGFLVLALPVGLGLALSEDRTGWRAALWVGVILTMWCWLAAFARGAWVGGAVGLIVVAVAVGLQRLRPRPVDYALGATALATVLLVAARSLSSSSEVMNVANRLGSIFRFSEGSALTRWLTWQAAVEAVAEKPVFGFGPDTFGYAFVRHRPVELIRQTGSLSFADNVHNHPLQLAATVGLPGALLFFGLMISVLARSAGSVFVRTHQPSRLVLASVWAALAGYLVHMLFGVSIASTGLLMWIVLGVLSAPGAKGKAVSAPAWGAIASVAAGVLAAAAIAVSAVFLAADASAVGAAPGGPGRVEAAEQAVRLNPYNAAYRLALAVAVMDERVRPAAAAPVGGGEAADRVRVAIAQSESAFEGIVAVKPGDTDAYLGLARLYRLSARALPAEASAYYEKSVAAADQGLEIDSLAAAIRIERSKALRSLGRTAEAQGELDRAREIDPALGGTDP